MGESEILQITVWHDLDAEGWGAQYGSLKEEERKPPVNLT